MYAPSVDMWSMGCICAEAMTGLPLFQSSENRPEKVLENITTTLGDIEKQWAGVRAMAEYKKLKGKLAGGGGGGGGGGAPGKGGANVIGLGLRNRLEEKLDRLCEKERRRSLYPVEKHLIGQMVWYNPELRISAEQALLHPYFTVPPEEHPHLSIHRVEQLFVSATASLARSLAADPQPVPLALQVQEGKGGLDEEIELGTASFDGHCAKCEADTLELPDIPLVPIASVVAELQRKQIFAKVHVSEEDAATAEVFGKSGVCIAQLIREVEEFGVKEGKEEEQGTS
ncbi:putative Protein kinase domain [Monocercomonoides exilis]|uniref:putative Protein kinase domain n=1 Tax=Monocercomonoides exilis TaxID=2049356 RepID=UPI003559AEDF|nr:putative Protein kinase domain [Monocercomonoides exilis]|eukprot:MONOS_6265.1-p1 / transcript=MONOS_6265.1 / gene=MONOS_6265 / organism=Monocercomonoides_exilis_PA203 / gene_product=unspecified product / transcript_product=unspecified product / location=Mono_scaffold00195:30326-31180(+) / protein_length=284 / sequence_SO=supercontig / SO=protein_coding / is_pseudo=false